MKIVYAYNRPASALEVYEAEKIWLDAKGTHRAERAALFADAGLRQGDVLILPAKSDLGSGVEAAALINLAQERGATVEIIPLSPQEAKRKPGRAKKVNASPEQQRDICNLWRSALDQKYVLERAAEILGQRVTRNQMNRLCGPRFKS